MGCLREFVVIVRVATQSRDSLLLRRGELERAKLRGVRPSVSAFLVDLVGRHRKELATELRG
jgi:hypothetical protein